MPINVVVQGSDGFIGKHLVKYLKTKFNYNVFEIPDDKTPWPEKIDCIFALGGLNGTEKFYNSPYDVGKVNIEAPIQALEKAIEHNASLVFTSTSENVAGYTDMTDDIPTPEITQLVVPDITNPRWSYSTAKIAAESLVISAVKQHHIDAKVVRLFNIYGPGDKAHVIPDIFNQLSTRRICLRGALNTRAFLYVEDCCSALEKVMFSGKRGEIYNIGSEFEMSIIDLSSLIQDVSGIHCMVEFDDAPNGSVSRRCPDITKLKNLGWTPKFNMMQGLATIWNKQLWIELTDEIKKRPYKISTKRCHALRQLCYDMIDHMGIEQGAEILITDAWMEHMEPERSYIDYLKEKYNAKITLIDINPTFEKATYADITKLPYRWTDKFDVVIDWSTCDHEENMPKFVSEYFRVLNSKGKLLIVNCWCSPIYPKRDVEWTDEQLAECLDHLFVQDDMGYIDPYGLLIACHKLHPLLPGTKLALKSRFPLLCAYNWRICHVK